ncbi:filamin-A [Aplysia californica]|uniref:Filamin-A n=1 Tax=Aplysia californica TaxID=6500 RepID=A0ABM0ZWU0_APLCA|nr:filamin-A [Aplysia californica]
MPSGNGLGPNVRDNADGTICVEYEPKQEGRHEVLMAFDGTGVDGSPFSCVVDKIDGSFLTAFGTGLVGGLSGDQESFTVVAKKGTAKDIEVRIDGPAKVDLQRKDNEDGSANFSYMPMTPGAYNIGIKYHGKPIKGSPFVAKVSGEGRKRSYLSVGNSAEYSLKIVEADIVDLVGTIRTPGGQIEPIILKKTGDGELAIASFTPREKGEYTVNVMRHEKNIKNSPFKIKVGDKEIGHAAGCRVTGAIAEAIANSGNELVIDTSDGGYGGLSVAIEGPHRSDVECYKVEDRVYTIHYSPHEPGIYILNIRFADDHIQGSPFLVNVGGNPSGRVRETVVKEMGQADATNAGTTAEFILKIPGTNPFDMEASITDPEGVSELCEVMDLEDFHYDIKMTPKENGLHTLSIKHKGMHISGSPFQYSVGQLAVGGPHKVQVGGPGLEKGEVGIPNVFNIYTREAGPGDLSVGVEGPSKAVIQLEQRPNGFLGAQFKVTKPGIYGVHLKFNDKHIPGSPFMVNVAPDSGVARQVTVHSLKDKGLAIDKPVTFTVAFNGATGNLHATMRTPSGAHTDCFTQEMDKGVYAVRFIPKENGVHYVDVKLNDAHIPDSPFAIMVGSTASDPAMVTASGDGLEHGKCGVKNKFVVKTAGAGSGLLAVFIDGPSKSALSCKEVDEGYEFSFTPFCPGNYLITIKYGNIPIAGSPYQTNVTGSGRKASPIVEQSSMAVETVEKKAGAGGKTRKLRGDASKVVAKGPGLKKAFTNRLQNFTVDVKDAGLAILSVGMIAPSGHPEAELSVKKVTATSYSVSYKVQEMGEHILHVKWGDDEIPGSPFVLCT